MKTIIFNDVELTVKQTKHTKTGKKIWLVNFVDRVDRETFCEINNCIKEMGGHYSRGFGFVFNEEPEFEEDEEVDYNELSRDELRELCIERDINFKKTYGKNKLIELLEENDEEDDCEEDDCEEDSEDENDEEESDEDGTDEEDDEEEDDEEPCENHKQYIRKKELKVADTGKSKITNIKSVAKKEPKPTSKSKGFSFEFKVDNSTDDNNTDVSYKECETFINKLMGRAEYEDTDHQTLLSKILKACSKDSELRKNIVTKDYDKCLHDGAEAWFKNQKKKDGCCVCTPEQIVEYVIEVYKKEEKSKETVKSDKSTSKAAKSTAKKPIAKSTSKKTIAKKVTGKTALKKR